MRRTEAKKSKFTRADTREMQRMRAEANAVSEALRSRGRMETQEHIRAAELFGVRRLVVDSNSLINSLTFDETSLLPQRGFYRNYPKKDRPTPNVLILNAYMAKEVGKRRPDSPEAYHNSLNELARSMPSRLSGALGEVCLIGAVDRPGLKTVGWYITSPLQETLMGETQKIYDAFKVPLAPRLPYITFAQTARIDLAENWHAELASATPPNTGFTLDRARPYPIPV